MRTKLIQHLLPLLGVAACHGVGKTETKTNEVKSAPAETKPAQTAPSETKPTEVKPSAAKDPCQDGEPAPSGPEAEEKLTKLSQELIPLVEKTRQIKAGKPVKMAWTSRREVCLYVTEEIKKQTSSDELSGQEAAAKVWGLVPDDVDLQALTLSLVTEQVAGFYDPRRDTLYVANWIPDFLQKPILAHEMYHGIQDQTLDMVKMLFELKNDDAKAAHSALFEGDGTLVMTLAAAPGADLRTVLPLLGSTLKAQTKMASAMMPVFASAPKALQESLLFPYVSGAEFGIYGAVKSGDFKLLDAAYQDLPASTEQILHPEKFFDTRDNPSVITFPDMLDAPSEWKLAYENTHGEMGLRLTLGKGDPKSAEAEAASGWDGDLYRVFTNTKGERALYAVFAWDDEAGAKKAAEALAARFPDGVSQQKGKVVSFARGFGDKNAETAKKLLDAKVEWKE